MYLVLASFFLCLPLRSSDSAFQTGERLSEELKRQDPACFNVGQHHAKFNLPGLLPQYAGTNVPQSHYYGQPESLERHAETAFANADPNSAADLLKMSEATQPALAISPQNHIFQTAERIVADPFAVLNAQEDSTVDDTRYDSQIVTCKEFTEYTTHNCEESRYVEVIHPPQEKRVMKVDVYSMGDSHQSYNCLTRAIISQGGKDHSSINVRNGLDMSKVKRVHSISFKDSFQYDEGHYRSRERADTRRDAHIRASWNSCLHLDSDGILTVETSREGSEFLIDFSFFKAIRTTPRTFEVLKGSIDVEVVYDPMHIIKERHDTTCQDLKERSRRGKCYLSQDTPETDPRTRIFSQVPVTRDWWSAKKTYTCTSTQTKDCDRYRAQDCTQVGQRCVKFAPRCGQDGVQECVEMEKTFECVKVVGHGKGPRIRSGIYCLDGDCSRKHVPPNKDMAHALSRLAAAREMQKEVNTKDLNIFKGTSLGCKEYVMDFRSCCDLAGGWGKLFGSRCNDEEKTLWTHRKKDRCVYVGTHSSNNVLGFDLAERASFCCFDSKIARVLQEQGRRQLGISWGTPEHPNCRALTLQEMERIDFDKIDLSELYGDFLDKVQVKDSIVTSQPTLEKWKKELPTQQDVSQGKLAENQTMAARIQKRGPKGSANATM